ncbi:hypothetical protein KBA27_06305 [bacterium]|nr:hypothetical protein [bacterium]
MLRGGKREGAGRKSRKLDKSKVSAYIQDRELLNQLAKELEIPTIELLHQVIIHKDFNSIIEELRKPETLKEWYKSND